MSKEDVGKFLYKREDIITRIEIALTIFQIISNKFSSPRKEAVDNGPYYDGCIYQFFAFIQRPLSEMLLTGIIAIAGRFDDQTEDEEQQLKDWKKILLSSHDERNIITQLKEIRNRYKNVRNNLICHIDNDIKVNDIPIMQIIEDIKTLRDIFNRVRSHNGLPLIGIPSISLASNAYAVTGLNRILTILDTNKSKTNCEE